jgi:serine/threonine-protein kinase HipA
MDALDVWLHDRHAGRLEQHRGRLSFAYEARYLELGGPPLSHALPLRPEPFDDVATESFFSNLLPEGKVRRAAARDAHVSDRNDFGLLAALGGDCAGAVSLLPVGEAPGVPAHPGRVEWLDDAALAKAIEDLPRRPLMADPDGDIRISLAGAQDKLVVVVEDDRIGLPVGSTPSSHIVKPPIDGYDGTVANEAFCLGLAHELGIGAVQATVREVAGHELLFVERYDRRADDGRLVRVHQEDFCQALGTPAEMKYQVEGGPGLADCLGLVRTAVDVPALDALRMADVVTFNFLIGNHDAHGKNFSLLHAREGTRVAPFYDLLSTTVYELGDKMAMKLGGEYRAGYVRRRHVEQFASETGLGAAAVLRRLRTFAKSAASGAESLAGELRAAGRHRPVIDRIVATVTERAARLETELAP